MMPEEFEFGSARVEFWQLDRLQLSIPLVDQIDELKEDLAQVRFGEHVVLDVGWYRSFPPSGRFVVCVVARGDWSTPVFQGEAIDLAALRLLIRDASEVSRSISGVC